MTPEDLLRETYEERKRNGQLTMFETWSEMGQALREFGRILFAPFIIPLRFMFDRLGLGKDD